MQVVAVSSALGVLQGAERVYSQAQISRKRLITRKFD